jgi:hypothetical protein
MYGRGGVAAWSACGLAWLLGFGTITLAIIGRAKFDLLRTRVLHAG